MSDYPPPPGPPPDPAQGYQQYGYGYGPGQSAEPAGFWTRFGAAFLDGLIVAIPLNILLLNVDQGPAFVLRLLVGAVYYIALEGSASGATVGKRALNIRVVDQDTAQPGIGSGRAAGRYFGRWLSALPLALGYLWMLWDPRKQTWHDKLARTLVVKVA
jgi:uncharacterized RDD family membrane protein YckC